MKAVGFHNWAAVVSDNTNVTKAARRLITEKIPTVLAIWDCVHHVQNMIGDITKLHEFAKVVLRL